MKITVRGAREHNLQGVDVEFGEGLTVVTGVSGSGKTSLVFDTLYHEARRRFLEVYTLGTVSSRLLPAHVESITGLGPAVAVGQNLLNRNPNSTLATAAGLHPFLRLLYAHYGLRTCPECGAQLSVFTDDELVERLVSLARTETASVYAPLLHQVIGSHTTLLQALSQHVDSQSLWVDGQPWDGQPLLSARPHTLELLVASLEPPGNPVHARQAVEKAAQLGAAGVSVAVGSTRQALARAPLCTICGRWFGDLKPAHFNQLCAVCQGKGCPACHHTGLPVEAGTVTWQGRSFVEILNLSVDEFGECLRKAYFPTSARRLQDEIGQRTAALQRVGLGYLTLNRASPTLSRGEAQRVRLALTLVSRLEDMLHVLDEPTIGLHPADVQRLLPSFRDLAGPVIFVEHERLAAAQTDQALDLGPGAGSQGGRVVFAGSPQELWLAETATARYFSLRTRSHSQALRPTPQNFLWLREAHLRNLRQIDVAFPLQRLTVVTGVSGSGKSTLVEDVLVASLNARSPVGCRSVEGPVLKPTLVDQSPIGRNPRSNPATYTRLAEILRDLFSSAGGLSPSHFSFNRPEGACPTCAGLGSIEIPMRYLPSTWAPCPDCEELRFSETVLSVQVMFGERSLSIADFLELSVTQAIQIFQHETWLSPANRQAALHILQALEEIGLGYLSLGQSSPSLSGGEAQRIKLARYLGSRSLKGQILLLDEPSTGLHPQDLDGLLNVLDRLVHSGATIVIVEHNLDIIRAADWIIDLGPGAGAAGGELLYAGPVQGLWQAPRSLTALALQAEARLSPQPAPMRPERLAQPVISIRGARMHNLKNVDVDVPKGKLTVVTGLSGSGKSSLVSDVLETEARRRFLESLSMYERQAVREGSEADVDAVTGLGVALTIGPERLVYSRRATVGTATEIAQHLAVLMSLSGPAALQRRCLECGHEMQHGEEWICPGCGAHAPLAKARHFLPAHYAAACQKCNGIGSLQTPQPAKLIVHPEKPLCNGAMYSPGFFPNGYLGKPFNHGYYMVLALAERYHFDPHATPWVEMSPQAQHAFLFGDPEPLEVQAIGHTGLRRNFRTPFPGFYGFIRDWDVGGTYTDTTPCPACQGARLRPEYLAVSLGGFNIYELCQAPLAQLSQIMDGLKPPEQPGQAAASLEKIRARLHFLIQVGLGYLHLDRVAGTLSAGEAQRIRLASLLGSGLTALTLLLDEPSRGLHPCEIQALLEALQRLRDEGNTVLVVEHDPLLMRAADHLIDMGPGAGRLGGQVVSQGTPAEVAQGPGVTARWLRIKRGDFLKKSPRMPHAWMILHGARSHYLCGESVRFPLGVLTGVCGVSGSGKSTLVLDTLGRALAPRKQTTSVAYEPLDPGEYDSIENAPPRTLIVDQTRAGIHSPAAFLGLNQPLRTLFAASETAQALGVGEAVLAAPCSACHGQGMIAYDMAFLPSVHVPCEVCQGSGHLPEAWQVRIGGLALPEVYRLTLDEVFDRFAADEKLRPPLQAAREVGLGYLALRQPGYTLSGGEAQRLKIAQELCRKSPPGSLYLLDEPSVGLHLEDVLQLYAVLERLVAQGGTVILVEHHAHLLSVCDWLIELGPGGGPQGGSVIASGTPAELARGSTPMAPYLRELLESPQ